jgi:hypothetical protein
MDRISVAFGMDKRRSYAVNTSSFQDSRFRVIDYGLKFDILGGRETFTSMAEF